MPAATIQTAAGRVSVEPTAAGVIVQTTADDAKTSQAFAVSPEQAALLSFALAKAAGEAGELRRAAYAEKYNRQAG